MGRRWLGVLAALTAGCGGPGDLAPARSLEEPAAFFSLRAEERALRASAIAGAAEPRGASFGPDPYDLAALPGGRFVGLLRGASAVVLLDEDLSAVGDPVPAPPWPTAVAVGQGGLVLVASGVSAQISAYQAGPHGIVRVAAHDRDVPGVRSVRDLAIGPGGCVYAVSEHEDLLVSWCGARTTLRHVAPGPIAVEVAADHVVVLSLLGHALSAAPLTDGLPEAELVTLRHDGPFFGLAAAGRGRGVLVAAGGVEDRPLDRTGGFFGNIDSFVYVYAFEDGAWRPLAKENASGRGGVTPKALALEPSGSGWLVTAAGYAGDQALELRLSADGATESSRTREVVAGLARLVGVGGRLVGASPLLDAWVQIDPSGEPTLRAASRDAPERGELFLGEALFYTSLMAPWQTSDGPKSRFTCETCHFEGGVDGRTHHTGRGDVRATTKPLRGIFFNAPHFTRALDVDTTEMVFAEFRVAAAGSGHDGWFSLREVPLGWARRALRTETSDRSAGDLRRALLLYLARADFAPNPAAWGREAWNEIEARGATAFSEVCARCHAARLAADDATTEVPVRDWQRHVLGAGRPIVWARDGYEKTGVVPYVHEDGARPTSLRRVSQKRPHFTNGSVWTLEEVLGQVRVAPGGGFAHQGELAGGGGLSPDQIRDLMAFLEIL